ncbi:hypothetical protein HX045_09385 [Myroides odoratimimus]|uniref:Lipocalin-like domain-containing protein n=3 Tax=Flavobacteriaceae TaxID=49546 RepID=A0AAI8C529_9FLAO|nr:MULTISPECIES: hypothetical protein [Myroides]APA92814.1 hypothetical protein BK054_11440 [Myroides sp. ZB35]AJA69542.1 Lipocalin-like domain [Myroides sp. A21]ALU26793.1 hypothetical protein AS202_11835 [Myroides odoratimimus]EHO13438.1 hypothetical protein HMPREF9715_01312 [Myroides odoratimimus CIP 101113]EKB07764.1 hypothetical protein HMPREF9711_00054 [Myroides odoratimimus CCUG 3837]
MRRCAQVLIGVLIIGMSSLLASCSADDNNNLEIDKALSVNSINIEKTWIVAHFDFQEGVSRSHKERYQKSLIEIDIMKGGKYQAIDKYSLEESKGNWVLEGEMISLENDADGEVKRYRIIDLSRAEALVSPINVKEISQMELVSFKK